MTNKKTPSYSDIQNDGIAAKGLKKIKGERLKKELKRAGFTHAIFAERVGYTAKYISEICSGNRQIPDNYIPSAAEIINERLRKQGDFVFPEYLAGKVDYRNENERISQYEKEWDMAAKEFAEVAYSEYELSKAFQTFLTESGYIVRSCIISDWAGMVKIVCAECRNVFTSPPYNIDRYNSQSEWISGESPSPGDIAHMINIISSYYQDIVYCVKTPVGELKIITHAELMHMYESAKSILGALFAGIIDRPGNGCSHIKQELMPLAKLPDLLK